MTQTQTALRVLIVDDEPAIRRALRPPLTELGFDVAEASRGEIALEMLRAEPYDVILLDVNMPGIGGLETLRRIRAALPRLPVLMLTVRDTEDEKVHALEAGADDYVTKPFSTEALVARMRALMRRSNTVPAKGELRFHDIVLDLAAHQSAFVRFDEDLRELAHIDVIREFAAFLRFGKTRGKRAFPASQQLDELQARALARVR